MGQVSLCRYRALAPAAVTTFLRSIKIHPPQPSQQLHSPLSWICAIVNLTPPWEKMGDFVLMLINASINDLSGFASEQGFIFFFYYYYFLYNCGFLLFWVFFGNQMSDFCIYIFTYVKDVDTPCQFTLPVFVVETHYFVVGMFKCHACKCYGNRYSSYGSKVEDLINIQGALVKLFCCSVHRYWHRRPWITWGRSEFRCVNFVQSKKLCANNRIKWKWS